ncbi:helicase-exonuclease AddAB subunit AddA [Veillonella sp. CHU732]|uniref:helicase-exonuclease AddAB subunit AddA n=1 Tax=Veillonella sp. CHU732 TaxID=2490949 RepID=UPI000F8CB033|nr:helicase-exonuclease AddAB subunit AddA [Veillonella sp. CHU732]
MKWTDAQQSAIDAPRPGQLPSQTILVSAAAGSGKTAVLVERMIQRLKRRELSIQELMVVTFTKAAAAEMKARIGVKLAEEFQATGDAYLEEQLNMLPSAHISTLHSFCQWVIRSYFYKLDIDPSFTIGNEGELALMRYDVLDAILLEAYEQGLYNIYDVSDMFSTERSDQILRDTVFQIYNFALAQSQPMRWLDAVCDTYESALHQTLRETTWGTLFWKEQQRQIEYLLERYEEAQRLATLGNGFDKWMEKVSELQTLLQAMQKADTWDAMHVGVVGIGGFSFPVLRATKAMNESDPAILSEIKAILAEGKEILQAMPKGVFAITEADWREQMEYLVPLVRGIIQLVKRFHEDFQQAKQEVGMIDFSDLEHLCLALLVDLESTEELKPSEVALELQDTFKEVMVDEYQDTNGVQEAIVNLVSRGDNRFYVGDVKQSIYGFRMADPQLFMEKYHRFDHDVNGVERRIDLSQNFRSHEAILNVTNFIFSQIMTDEGAGLTYGEAEALHTGRIVEEAPPEWVGGDVEVHVLCCDEDKAQTELDDGEDLENDEKEMLFVIRKIQELKNNGAMVQDKDGTFRLMEWRDIVLLKRSISGSASRMIDLLRREGIPAYAEEKSGYFSAMEVQFVLSLLQIIDNPEQDLPMAIVLQSPLIGMDANDLGRLRLSVGEDSLWSGLRSFVETSQNAGWIRFVDSMDTWRTMSRRQGITDLIWHIYDTLHVVEYVSAMPNGLVRRGNVLALYERAKQYESGNYRGLFRFLRFIESLQASGEDLSVAKTVSEADNVVRIMTIHKSKGLEFPVVFLMGTQKGFNKMDLNRSLLLHKEYGVGLKGYFPDLRVMYNSLPWIFVRQALEENLKAEEERILYVALTRPKDKLYITGYMKGSINGSTDRPATKKMGEWVAPVLQWGESAFTKEQILGCNSYLDWILRSLARHVGGGTQLRQFAEVESPQFPDIPYKDCPVSFHVHDGNDYSVSQETPSVDVDMLEQVRAQLPVEAPPLDPIVVDRLTSVYPYESSTERAGKISVSEIKRRFVELEELAKQMIEPDYRTEQHNSNIEGESGTPDRSELLVVDSSKDLHSSVEGMLIGDSMLDSIPDACTDDTEPTGEQGMENGAEKGKEKGAEDISEEAPVDLGPFDVALSSMNESTPIRSGARWGTLMHEVMQWLPLENYTRLSLRKVLDNLALQGYLTDEERKAISEKRIYDFFQSDLGQRLLTAQRVERELPFSMLFPANRVYPEMLDGEDLFLQGIIDTAFLEDSAWVLVDYKTDRLDEEALVERYRIQLMLYKEALERLTPYPVKEVYIYSFRLERAISV